MRLKLTLSHGNNAELPINYSYLISAWIYHTLERADPAFASWLHERGYGYHGRHYKLFTFSRLYPRRYRIAGDRFVLQFNPTDFYLSFYLDEAVGHFVMGLFREQRFSLFDQGSSVEFEISSVEVLPKPVFHERMRFRLQTPLCLSRDEAGKAHAQYLHPEDEGYEQAFFGNLIHKYKALQESQSTAPGSSPAAFLPDDQPAMHFKALSTARSRLLDIKGIKVRGFEYDFEISAAPELIELGYYAGFGEKNSSLGFGFAGVLKGE